MRYYLITATTFLGTFTHWVTDFIKHQFLDEVYPYADKVELTVKEISKKEYDEATR